MMKRARKDQLVVPYRRMDRSRNIINTVKTLVNAQQNITLYTASIAGQTVSLRRIQFDMLLTNNTSLAVCLQIVRDGVSAATIALGDGNQFIEPEENALYWTYEIRHSGLAIKAYYKDVPLKVKRKLKEGDSLVLSILGDNATGDTFHGITDFYVMQ